VAGGDGAVAIDLTEFAFQPNTFTVAAGMDAQVTFTNRGQLPHNFTCDALGIATQDLAPGATETVTINTAAGSYDFHCSIPGHADAGMIGNFTAE
jgi:uncharacterized cupredoxin-like copper-binding protein